jgi:hypothetical protein
MCRHEWLAVLAYALYFGPQIAGDDLDRLDLVSTLKRRP